MIKAQTLGASTWQIVSRVVLPQILPRLIDVVRLEIGPAWLFLIAAEAIAADSGLGYRIFLVRRYLVDGRDPALRGVDHAARLPRWISACACSQRKAYPVVRASEGGMSAIVFDKVWKEYGDHVVLEQIDLKIEPRAFLALVGPSGCGKTTFLRMLLGEERPTRGAILLDGKPLKPEPDCDRGVVFQRYSVFPHLTVLQNVMIGREFEFSRGCGRAVRRQAPAGAKRSAASCWRRWASPVNEDKYPSALSGGMQQRLALAQALMRKPKMLLLDEPFGALDPGIRADIHVLMKRIWKRPI